MVNAFGLGVPEEMSLRRAPRNQVYLGWESNPIMTGDGKPKRVWSSKQDARTTTGNGRRRILGAIAVSVCFETVPKQGQVREKLVTLCDAGLQIRLPLKERARRWTSISRKGIGMMNTIFNATRISTPALLSAVVLAAAPVQAADKAQQQADIRKTSQAILSELIRIQPSAQGAVERAAGFAIFSTSGLKIFVAGGGIGTGMAVNNQTKQVVFMKMAEVQAGLGMGFSKLKQVWVFETQGAFDNFVNSGWEFGGQATLTAQAAGQGGGYAGAIPVSPGVWIYQLTGDGLAASITVKGSKYYKADDLN